MSEVPKTLAIFKTSRNIKVPITAEVHTPYKVSESTEQIERKGLSLHVLSCFFFLTTLSRSPLHRFRIFLWGNTCLNSVVPHS